MITYDEVKKVFNHEYTNEELLEKFDIQYSTIFECFFTMDGTIPKRLTNFEVERIIDERVAHNNYINSLIENK